MAEPEEILFEELVSSEMIMAKKSNRYCRTDITSYYRSCKVWLGNHSGGKMGFTIAEVFT